MDWKSLGESVAKLGLPILGTALLGPAGGTIGAALASYLGTDPAKPEAILQALGASPEALQKAKEFELEKLKVVTNAEIEERKADSSDIAAVNETMRQEGKSEHWMQWSWRPMNGFALAFGSFALVIGVLIMAGIAIYNKDFTTLNSIPTVVMAVTAALAIPGAVCGVTAWHRGIKQIEEVKQG